MCGLCLTTRNFGRHVFSRPASPRVECFCLKTFRKGVNVMTQTLEKRVTLSARDATGQNASRVSSDVDATVGELVADLLAEMELPKNDPTGRALTYHARLEREGRHLHAAERVGDALEEDDKLVLVPNIQAG